MTLKICVAQLNLIVGDLHGNAQKMIAAAHEAYEHGARLLLTPELSICGYAAEDLFLRPAFISACHDAVKMVANACAGLKGMVVVVGHPTGGDERSKSVAIQRRFNAASVISEGRILETYAKRELPNYQVFDERRYFTPGQGVCVFQVGEQGQQVSVGLLICEDAWFEEPAQLALEAGAQVLAVINASPFHVGKGGERVQRMADRVKATGLPLIYAHLVGGQDEVVFDGGSFALNAKAELVARAENFKEKLLYIGVNNDLADVSIDKLAIDLIVNEVDGKKDIIAPQRSDEADLWDALVLGIHDYLGKNGFPGAILGLSGGIDSALVLALAVDALGKDKVRAVMMPSPYTADISWIDARDMAKRMGVRYDEISIVPEFEAFKKSLAPEFAGLAEDTTEENIQARIRGTLLMALSNKSGRMVLTTGNKSEMATGYCTLYGDMAGGFAAIKDIAKTTVFKLCQWRNLNDPNGTGSNPIPERIITRPPSAELRADQKDQDSLPPYEVLDAILERYMENDQSIAEILTAGFAPADVQRVTHLIKINEHKRRQAPIGIRVTHRSFGKDWRYPITSKFRA
jgi:NAD+ synthase (glutamine-hydrolysing)